MDTSNQGLDLVGRRYSEFRHDDQLRLKLRERPYSYREKL